MMAWSAVSAPLLVSLTIWLTCTVSPTKGPAAPHPAFEREPAGYRTEADALLDSPAVSAGGRDRASLPIPGAGGENDSAAPSIEVHDGAADLRAIPPAGSAIVGCVLLDPGVPCGLVSVRVACAYESASGESKTARYLAPLERSSGRFRIDGLPPGWARIDIISAGTGDPAVTIDWIELIEGEWVRDPRLDRIDLRGRYFAYRIDVLDELGRPIERPFARRTDGSRVWRWSTDESAEGTTCVRGRGEGLWVLTEDPVIDLEFGAEGYVTRRLDAVASDLYVVLHRELEVRLILEHLDVESAATLEEGIAYLVACIHPDVSEHDSLCGGGRSDDETGELILGAQAPGPHHLFLSVGIWYAWDEFEEVVIGPGTGLEQVLSIRDVGGPQRIRIDLSRPVLDSALRRAEARIEAVLDRAR